MPAPEPGPFGRFLGRALGALEREAPGWHTALARAVGAAGLALDVGDESFALRFDGAELRLDPAPPPDRGPALRVATDRATIVALADGDISLVHALESDRLFVRGPLDDVLRFDTALLSFFEGAVRAPSLAPMLDRLRTGALEQV